MNDETSNTGTEAQSDTSSNKAKGGKARAEKLSAAERKDIAKKAAKSRWDARRTATGDMPRVLEGFSSVLDLVGTSIPCAVIQGTNGIQRVLSETGITKALLGSRSGASKRLKKSLEEQGAPLPLFMAPRQLLPFINKEMIEGPLAPIEYVDGNRVVLGYDAAVLPLACDIWLRARENGGLQPQQLAKAQQAEILARALAQTGIVALVDEATGYQEVRPQNALQEYLKHIIREQLAAWVKKFPDEFFENIYKLRGWTWPGMKKNRYSVVGHYIRDLVYERMAAGALEELERKTPKDDKGRRGAKMHQWLTEDIGDPMLSNHLHTLIMFQRFALANGHGWNKFVQSVDQVLPKKGANLLLPLSDPNEPAPPSSR